MTVMQMNGYCLGYTLETLQDNGCLVPYMCANCLAEICIMYFNSVEERSSEVTEYVCFHCAIYIYICVCV